MTSVLTVKYWDMYLFSICSVLLIKKRFIEAFIKAFIEAVGQIISGKYMFFKICSNVYFRIQTIVYSLANSRGD